MRCPLFIGCRHRREEGLQEAVVGGQESRRRWWEVGRKHRTAAVASEAKIGFLLSSARRSPPLSCQSKWWTSASGWWREDLKGPARLHRQTHLWFLCLCLKETMLSVGTTSAITYPISGSWLHHWSCFSLLLCMYVAPSLSCSEAYNRYVFRRTVLSWLPWIVNAFDL